MPVFYDQTGRSVTINLSPQRIVSLVPSQTELLADMGLEHEVIGITKFCVHPARWFRSKVKVGGTRQVNMEILYDIRPDLIIGNKEENTREQIDTLAVNYPVWISDVTNLASAYEMIEAIGKITTQDKAAANLITTIKKEFSRLPTPGFELRTHPKAAYLIWKDPLMTIGHDTFIHSMLQMAGFRNVFENKTRYPETSITELSTLRPDILLLSSEPYPFKEKHSKELQTALPGTQILLVDGEMFSWYGSRLQYAPGYIEKLWNQLK